MSAVKKITKVLSTNDAGVNSAKGHGVLIPKNALFQSFFPPLDPSKDNPSTSFVCRDALSGEAVELMYRYYNKTKNEYRITGISKYLRANHAVAGSRLSLSKTDAGDYVIELEAPDAQVGTRADNAVHPDPATPSDSVDTGSTLEERSNEPGTVGQSELNATKKRRAWLGMELTLAIIGEWEVVS